MKSLPQILLALFTTVPACYGAPLVLGDSSGNARGTNSIDIQTARDAATQVAGGTEAVSMGLYNTADSLQNIAVGIYNSTTGNGNGGEYATAFGNSNSVTGFAAAYGFVNTLSNFDPNFYAASMAFGAYNTTSGSNSYAFGENNVLGATHTAAVGFGISNYVANSLMIGPSDAAKVTILPSGNVGIGLGTASPTQKLDVGGNIRLSGNIINASGNTVTLPSGGGTLVTTSGTQTITGTTTVQGTTTLGGASTAQQLKVDVSTGNVGIGAAPDSSAKLNVSGAAKFGGEVGVGTGASTDGANLRLLASASDAQWNLDNNTGSLRFFTETSPGAGATTHMTIAPTGYVGIGTASPRPGVDLVRTHAFTGAMAHLRTYSTTGASFLKFVKNHGTEAAPTDVGTLAYERIGEVSFTGRYNNTEQTAIILTSRVDNIPAPGSTILPGYFAIGIQGSDVVGAQTRLSINSQGLVDIPKALSVGETATINGATQLGGNVTVKNNAVIRVSPAGDITMAAEFQSGINPAN